MSVNEWSDATAMAEAVRNKTVSPRELVKDTISEAERTNTKINAIGFSSIYKLSCNGNR